MSPRRVRRVGRPELISAADQPSLPSRPPAYRRRPKLGLVIWALLLMGLVIGVGAASQINTINFSPSHYQAEARTSLTAYLDGAFWHRQLWGLDAEAAAQHLEADLADKLAEVKIAKRWFGRSIEVTLVDRRTVVRWQTSGQVYGVDQKGIVTGQAGESLGAIPLVVDQSNLEVSIGRAVAPAQFVKFVLEVSDNLPDTAKVNFRRGRVIETTNELFVDTSAGWFLRFDTTRSSADQLADIERLLGRGIKPTRYIDVRLPYKSYWR